MRNKIFIGIGVLLVLGLIWFKLSSNQRKANEEIQAEKEMVPFAVEAISVKEKQFSGAVSYPGVVEIPGTVNLASETDGRVVRLTIQNGSPVQKGQVIAVLDNQSKTPALHIHQIDYDKAKADYQRYSELYKQKNATKVELETARQVMETAEKQLILSRTELRKGTIVSPVSGVVSNKAISVGDYLSIGSPVAVIVPLSDLDVRCNIPEREISNIKKGQKVSFTVDAYPDHQFEGIASVIIPTANQAKAFPVLIKVKNNQHDLTLMGGMTVNVVMHADEKNTALVIPRTAVRGDFKAPYVWIVGEGKQAVRRSIQLGRELEDQVEVVSGLKAGDTIVSKGQANITEGLILELLKMEDSKTSIKN